VDGIFELDLDGDTIVDFTIEHILGGGQLGNVNEDALWLPKRSSFLGT